MSTKVHNLREGDRSEYFAQVLLSGLGLSTPIPRQEDIGFDFHCSLADQTSGVLTFGHPYLVSVKSLSKPNIELYPTDAAAAAGDQRHIEWLFRQELPFFLGVVDKANFQMRLYSLIPLWFIYYEGGPRCGSLLIKPRLDSADLSHVDRPKDVSETANWPGMRHFDVDLGHPIAVVDLDVLKSQEATDAVRKNIRRAAKYARTCQVHYHLGIPYFHWIAVTQPDGKSFYPAFAQFPIPPTAEARVQIMQQLAPSLISFALHYKEANDVESLAAIRRLIREVPREFFEPPIQAALPELFPK